MRSEGAVHLVAATQSPHEVAEDGARMLAASRFGAKRLVVHPCYTVGYGSKDHCPFPFYALTASLYGERQRPGSATTATSSFSPASRRHSFRIRYRLAVDRDTGKFTIFQGDMTGDGGGRQNFSHVGVPGGGDRGAVYLLLPAQRPREHGCFIARPRRGFRARLRHLAEHGRDRDAGRRSGRGTAHGPIELRQRNVFASGMKNTQGAIPGGALRADEVLARCRAHSLWQQRATRKHEYEATLPGKRYGVGFACVQKDFGTGAEAAFAEVALARDGQVLLRQVGIDMGTGMATSHAALCVRWLGRPADEVRTGEIEWPELPMFATGNPWLMQQDEQVRQASNPRWTPYRVTPSSASNSAYFYGHATREAARLIFTQGLWPAALALWGEGFGGGQLAPLSVRREDAHWVDGKLTAGSLVALPLARLAKKAYELGLATGAIVHTFNRWQWAEAEFPLSGDDARLPLDGVALRWGQGMGEGKGAGRGTPTANGYRMLERTRVHYPPAQRNNAGVVYYSAIGTIAEVAVDTASGRVELLNHHSVLECGNQIVPELVSGQLQGGLAMGIGHALHEYLPLYEDGPGNGTWNFNRYTLPRARDVAVWKQTGEVLPALSPSDPNKGMAEVVMIAVVPAIVNAIAHATGLRFRELPVTAEKVLAALAGVPTP